MVSFAKKPFQVLAVLFLILSVFSQEAHAQRGPLTIIRDTEIESALKEWTSPLARAAGLDPASVNVIIVQNGAVNAFVAGGPNIFIYTGLIEDTENPGELAGVIAHELGHISAGHLIRLRQSFENASYESLLGALLGIGAAIATGDGGVGAAVAAGTQNTAARRFLSHSRVNESSADQAALTYLQRAGLSADGLVSFLEKLADEDILPEGQQTEYVRTHPIGRNRINALEERAARITGDGRPYPAHWEDQHARMKAKLTGYIHPERVAWDYSESDSSIDAQYAYAISAYRLNKIDKALKRIDALIDQEQDNPYFLELKAQMLRDFGRVGESVSYYRKAADLTNNAPLITISYAHALLETARGDKRQINRAITLLNQTRPKEPRSARIHRLLATAYGRIGQNAHAKLHLAEEALLESRHDFAEQQAEAAKQQLPKGSREWIRANDILLFAQQEKDR